jgi:hypothetical protein
MPITAVARHLDPIPTELRPLGLRGDELYRLLGASIERIPSDTHQADSGVSPPSARVDANGGPSRLLTRDLLGQGTVRRCLGGLKVQLTPGEHGCYPCPEPGMSPMSWCRTIGAAGSADPLRIDVLIE